MTQTPGPEQGQPEPELPDQGHPESTGSSATPPDPTAAPPPPPPPPPQPPSDAPSGQPWQPPPPQADYPPAPPQGWQPNQGGYGQGGYGQAGFPGQQPTPGAPYGVHPGTGLPYSDKTKLIAGLLQILIPFGVGRFYLGYTNIGVAQLLVTLLTCGVGALWPVIDGILILVNDAPKDAQGRVLRSS